MRLSRRGISIIVTLLFNASIYVKDSDLGMMAPVIFLSLLVISVALMGYLFFYQPVRLLVEHKAEEAGKLLLSTIASFAGIIGSILLLYFLLTRAL